MFVCCMIEFALQDLLGLPAKGFSEDQLNQVNDYDEILEEIGEKWYSGEGGKISPETRFGMFFTFNLFCFIIANYCTQNYQGIGGFVQMGKVAAKDIFIHTYVGASDMMQGKNVDDDNWAQNIVTGLNGIRILHAGIQGETGVLGKTAPRGPKYPN